jgi:Arc/MetJ-type ribon-helix-helix transcriptional regulator
MTGTSPRFAKVTISLPPHVLSAVDRLQRKTGQSRSEIFRHAVEELFASENEREAERRWLNAYRARPQSEADHVWTEASLESLASNEWDSPTDLTASPRQRTKRGA